MRWLLWYAIIASATVGCGRLSFDAQDAEKVPGRDASDIADSGLESDSAVTELILAGQDTIADTSVESFNDALNCGLCTAIDGGDGEAGLIRIELGALPDGAAIVSATLELWLVAPFTPGGATSAFVVTEAWQEGEQDYQRGVPNWTQRLPGIPWTSDGVGPGSRADQPFATFVPDSLEEPLRIELPVATAQGWLEDPATNFGLALQGKDYPGSGGDHPHFHATESTLAAERGPKLIVRYTAMQ